MSGAGTTIQAGPSPLDRGRLRARLAAGQATVGTFIGAASPVTAEACAAAGVDWLVLDLEHGSGGEEQVRQVVPAAGAYGVPTVVRAAAGRHGKACGLLVGDGAAARRLAEGWRFVAIGSDATLLAAAVTAELTRVQRPAPSIPGGSP